MSNDSSSSDDAGVPLPNFNAQNIQLQTVAPALGVPAMVHTQAAAPDYLDYDPKGRGIVVTMFANAGTSYLMGITAGGLYGFRQGLQATPNTRFRVQLNSILNHCGRYGSRAGNTLGVFSVLYSLYEGLADNVSPKFASAGVAVSCGLACACGPPPPAPSTPPCSHLFLSTTCSSNWKTSWDCVPFLQRPHRSFRRPLVPRRLA